MSVKESHIQLSDMGILYRWRNYTADRKHFSASDIRELVKSTRYQVTYNKQLDALLTFECSDDTLRKASVQIIGALAATGDDDLIWTWVWVAAALGERFAGLALAGRLLREAADIDHRNHSHFRRLARAAAFPDYFSNSALEELIEIDRVSDWLLKISAQKAERAATQSRLASKGAVNTGRQSLVQVIRSEESLSAGRRADDRKTLDGLDILRTGVSVIGVPNNLKAIRQAISLDFPWAIETTDAVFDDLSFSALSGSLDLRITPTILVGPPAAGKTSYVELLSTYLRMPCAILSAAGSGDNRFLAGTAKGWSSSEPSFPADFMAKTASANPLIFIDEIEKASTSHRNGRLQDTLLMMVEPASACRYMDEFIGLPVDLSNINWMAGANSLSGISQALQSRFRIIRFEGPKEQHFEFIFERTKYRIAKTLNIRPEDLPKLDPKVTRALFQLFRRTLDMRRLYRALRATYARSMHWEIDIYH